LAESAVADNDMNDFIRMLATWALVHEVADESWKASVSRGRALAPDQPGHGPEAFVDGLAALVAEEKERLKASLDAGAIPPSRRGGELHEKLDALAFELAELRGRIESLQASIDALTARGRE
jgi:hypothetical protein